MFNFKDEELTEVLNAMLDVPEKMEVPANVHFFAMGFVIGRDESGATVKVKSAFLTTVDEPEAREVFIEAVLERIKTRNRAKDN